MKLFTGPARIKLKYFFILEGATTLSITTLSILAYSIMSNESYLQTLTIKTLSTNDTQHKCQLAKMSLSINDTQNK
jgi:hypothetical protein